MLIYMLKPNSRLILMAIMANCPSTGGTLRMAEIAQKASCSRHTVIRHIRRLSALGYIALHSPCNGVAYHYEVLPKAREELN